MDSLYLLSIGSGSCGNSYYLGTKEWGVLVDAGVSAKNLKRVLVSAGLSERNVLAVFITHDHADHVRFAGSIEEKFFVPVYATKEAHRGMERRGMKIDQLNYPKHTLALHDTLRIRDLEVEAFPVPHDGGGCVGYCFQYDDLCVVFSGDLGHISQEAETYFKRAHYLILESDYDEERLLTGGYSKRLQERIKSPKGHLSNREASQWVATHYTLQLKGVFLSHISGKNNTPLLAINELNKALEEKGIKPGRDLEVNVFQRTKPSNLYELKK